MKELIIIRHCKSDWSNEALDDFDRPLNKRGQKDGPFMAKLLKDKVTSPDLIVCSPSHRTKLTLEYFIEEFEYKGEIIFEKSIYEAPFENLLKVINSIDNKYNKIFFIGHNPGVCDLTNTLTDENLENIPTSGIVKIDFNTDSWENISKENSKMIFFEYPKKYK